QVRWAVTHLGEAPVSRCRVANRGRAYARVVPDTRLTAQTPDGSVGGHAGSRVRNWPVTLTGCGGTRGTWRGRVRRLPPIRWPSARWRCRPRTGRLWGWASGRWAPGVGGGALAGGPWGAALGAAAAGREVTAVDISDVALSLLGAEASRRGLRD